MEDSSSMYEEAKQGEKTTLPISIRSSLKSDTHFNNHQLWKHKLKENCYRRIREDRNRLLWKTRLPSSQYAGLNKEEILRATFQCIVSDELKKIRPTSFDESLSSPASDANTNDILWEYDGLCKAYEGDCEEILLEMQRIFYEDLRMEPTSKGLENQMDKWEDEEDEYLATAVYNHMQLNERKEIWCPVCKRGELKENCRRIYCTICELELKKDNELKLDILRARLAEAHTEHLDRGCRLRPTFCVQTKFDLTALYMACAGCDTFEIVI